MTVEDFRLITFLQLVLQQFLFCVHLSFVFDGSASAEGQNVAYSPTTYRKER